MDEWLGADFANRRRTYTRLRIPVYNCCLGYHIGAQIIKLDYVLLTHKNYGPYIL